MTTGRADSQLADPPPDTGRLDPSLGGMVLRAAATRPGAALRFHRDGAWREMGYRELGDAVRQIARGLIALGIDAGDRVAILSETRPEWTLADSGTLAAGAVVVPVYQTSSPEEVRYILEHSGARLVFCEDERQLEKVQQVREELPRLAQVVLLTGSAPGALSFGDFLQRGAAEAGRSAVDARLAAVRADDPATIVYTSGTTGPPKGCVLSHANLLQTVRMYVEALGFGRARFSIFMFLPLAHVLARVAQFVALEQGGTIAYWRRDPVRLLDDLAEIGPTHLPCVPRVLEKVHARAQAAADSSPIRAALFLWALRTGAAAAERRRGGEQLPWGLRARQALADRLVLSKVRRLFGGRLEMVLTGAAPIGREVLEFFETCGVRVLEGYGLTESCAAATLNTPSAARLGTVGRALPGVELAIRDDGEVLMRGANVFGGYLDNDRATGEVLSGGWLRTGDLGSLDSEGFLTITGRKKDLIITSSGKNITPTNIEAALRERPLISQAVVYGDRRPYLVALIALDPDELPALAKRFGIRPDPGTIARDERMRELVQAEVDAVNSRFARIEQIKRFAILERDLSEAAGELTPTLKVKRTAVYERHADTIEQLYSSSGAPAASSIALPGTA